ncbi:putative carboxymethylenebutenolidase [Mycobacterium kansasii 732]|nr:putative carboxymethylenebutenolidase [Mycobacterium kansasii 732]
MTDIARDLGAIFDEHVAHEFVAKDLAATMATMTADPYVNHVPTMMGGVGAAGVAEFYGQYFIGHWPEDTRIIPVCRTVGSDRVVDEMIMSFTHDIAMPTFLPNVAPTGRAVMLPVVVVMGFEVDPDSGSRKSPTNGSTGIRPRCWCRSDCCTRTCCRSSAWPKRTRSWTRTCRQTRCYAPFEPAARQDF